MDPDQLNYNQFIQNVAAQVGASCVFDSTDQVNILMSNIDIVCPTVTINNTQSLQLQQNSTCQGTLDAILPNAIQSNAAYAPGFSSQLMENVSSLTSCLENSLSTENIIIENLTVDCPPLPIYDNCSPIFNDDCQISGYQTSSLTINNTQGISNIMLTSCISQLSINNVAVASPTPSAGPTPSATIWSSTQPGSIVISGVNTKNSSITSSNTAITGGGTVTNNNVSISPGGVVAANSDPTITPITATPSATTPASSVATANFFSSTAGIIAIVVPCVLLLLIGIGLLIYWFNRPKTEEHNQNTDKPVISKDIAFGKRKKIAAKKSTTKRKLNIF